MLSFLLTEGVLTVGTISGIFTATLLGSLKTNIIDPFSEQVLPTHKLDIGVKDTSGNNGNKENMVNILDANNYSISASALKKIKWQTFLKDLITWIIIMFILFLIWNYLIKNIQKTS